LRFELAWRNLWRNWRRTTIALIAIVLGLLLLLFLDGIIYGSDQAIFGNAVRLYGGNVQVHAPGYRERARRLPLYPLADAEAVLATVRAQPGVLAASRRIHTGGFVSRGDRSRGVVLTGIEPEIERPYSIVAENITEGRYLEPDDRDLVLIGKGLAEELGVGVGDRVAVLGRGRNEALRQRTMTVVGIYALGMRDLERSLAFLSLQEAQGLYRLPDQATEVAITLPRVGDEHAFIPTLAAALPGYEVDSWETLRPEVRQTIDSKATFSGIMGMIVLLVACIGILNILLMAVFERTREMGILAALGMKGRHIVALFVLEGTLLGALGALIGCGLGLALVALVGRVGIPFPSLEGMGDVTALMGTHLVPVLRLEQVVARGVAVTAIAALASLYPAWLATRKQPAEVLRHV
jgi:ABC-type lipoprotein release transport system permease subunit